MAAYPMVQGRPWLAFITELEKHDVERKTSVSVVMWNGAEGQHLEYLSRTVGNVTYRHPLIGPLEGIVTPSLMRSVCSALRIDMDDFSFTAG